MVKNARGLLWHSNRRTLPKSPEYPTISLQGRLILVQRLEWS